MARTYIILVNWNGYADTIECLESLLRLDDGDFHVVIVDNGSTDGSIGALRRWSLSPADMPVAGDEAVWRSLPQQRRHDAAMRVVGRDATACLDTRITVIEAGANLGFAGANNLGFALAAQDPDCAWLWVLNNDTVVAPDSLSQLVTHGDAHPSQAIFGATLVYYHNPAVVQGLGGWLHLERAKSGHICSGTDLASLPDTDRVEERLAYVMGAAMFVRRAAYDDIGGMSEDYFLYYEELDWAARLPATMSQGWCRSALIFHKEGGSIGTSSTAHRPSDTSTYYLRRGALRFYRRFHPRYLPILVARIVFSLIGHAIRRDTSAIRVISQALFDAARGRSRRGPFNSPEFRA